MVDIWLIFCIGITFLVIIFHAFVDAVVNTDSNDPQSNGGIPKLWYVRPADQPTKPKPPPSPWINAYNLVLLTKITTPLVFIIFNLGYWGYIFSNKISGY